MNSKESVSSKDKQIKQYKLIRIRKILKTLKIIGKKWAYVPTYVCLKSCVRQ